MAPPGADPARAVRDGKLDIELNGYEARGAWTLVRTRYGAWIRPRPICTWAMAAGKTRGGAPGQTEKEQWLLIKQRDSYARGEDVTQDHQRSVLSGLTIEEMRNATEVERGISSRLKRYGSAKLRDPLEFKYFPLTLANRAEEPFDGNQWIFEIKYDGIRALAIRDGVHPRLYARSGAEITERYPEVLLALAALPCDRFVIDGEVVALDQSGHPSFQLLQRRMHLSDAHATLRLSLEKPACIFVFDLLAFAGFDLRGLPLKRRKELLHELIKGEGPLRYCDHIEARGVAFYGAAERAGLEGIVAKRSDAPYRGKRTGDWVNIKCAKTNRFVIGGWTDPAGSRLHFGALLVGRYEGSALRFMGRVGTGFDQAILAKLGHLIRQRASKDSPFRKPRRGELAPPRGARFCVPELVAEIRYSELTDEGALRHPSFIRLIENAQAKDCSVEAAGDDEKSKQAAQELMVDRKSDKTGKGRENQASQLRIVTVTHPEKIFWPAQRYTKQDLVDYYLAIAKWMLRYLKDRPLMMVRFPDGIDGKSFYQKDAPGFAPDWIRTERIYSEDSKREISYFVIESAEALAYVANLGTIPLHVWSSRIGSLEHPDWLLFDIDPKGSTTSNAILVALEACKALRRVGLRPCVKTSGQMGIHVVVGLRLVYSYEQARSFAELLARIVVAAIPEVATIERNTALRKGRVYIDYLQLGHGKTIAAPFTVRPIAGAPVSAPIKLEELTPALDPASFTIRNMPARMKRLKFDPFLAALDDPQTLEDAVPLLEHALHSVEFS
jgi:bifunctional non-homologous end joining protein LigD